MKRKLVSLLFLLVLTTGCAKKAAVAPVPGSINALDAWAFRIVSDSAASIHSVKIWEQCSAASFPPTVSVDGSTEVCDPKAGTFPQQYKPDLNDAINALNIASATGKAYHSGALTDTNGLNSAVNQLSAAVTKMVTSIGGAK